MRIENDSPERPIPLPAPTDFTEQVGVNGKGMVHMRELHKMGLLTGEINSKVSWMDAPSTYHDERLGA